MDRREFTALLPSLLAVTALLPETATAQQPETQKPHVLLEVVSGVYPPLPAANPAAQRVSHKYLAGMLKAGNIQIEMHETTQQPGTPHEAIGKHLHNELWMVREGVCELTTNGVTRTMNVGDVGVCCAGDLHYIRNAGETACTYFVVTVGPPENPA
jgi:mannose-6-phosphate isomerase-like protein (cupin superfamily)